MRINGIDYPQPSRDFRPIRAGAQSSNVYEFGYDIDNHYLYVRYQEPHEHGTKAGPGRSIATRPCSPTSSLRYNAGSKGIWVRDNLRIRGTISGHQHGSGNWWA